MIDIDLPTPEHTAWLGAVLANLLRGGDMVVLSGDLGAGKTTLVRAIAAARGVDPRAVSSPTFTVVHEYATPDGPPVVHVDAYRLDGTDEDELLQLGWDRSATSDAIVLIEWGERIEALLPGPLVRLTLSHEGDTERLARLEAPDAWRQRAGWGWLEAFAAGEDGPQGPGRTAGFASDREQWADLYRWMSGSYRLSRPMNAADLETD